MLIVDKELKKEEKRRKELCGKMLGGKFSEIASVLWRLLLTKMIG